MTWPRQAKHQVQRIHNKINWKMYPCGGLHLLKLYTYKFNQALKKSGP